MWQELREKTKPKGCEIVTVALDATGGTRAIRYIEKAGPRHPALIDQHHTSARLFRFVNVPSSVWIDERGMLVRPAEVAPRPPGRPLFHRDPLPEDIPDRMRGIAEETTRINYNAGDYHRALDDWIANGQDSRFALSPAELEARSTSRDADAARGQAHFEMATHLESIGDHQGAVHHFRETHRLCPDNWLFRRQAWSLEPGPNRFWQGPSPEDPESWPYRGDWLADVRAEGAENYYRPFRP